MTIIVMLKVNNSQSVTVCIYRVMKSKVRRQTPKLSLSMLRMSSRTILVTEFVLIDREPGSWQWFRS